MTKNTFYATVGIHSLPCEGGCGGESYQREFSIQHEQSVDALIGWVEAHRQDLRTATYLCDRCKRIEAAKRAQAESPDWAPIVQCNDWGNLAYYAVHNRDDVAPGGSFSIASCKFEPIAPGQHEIRWPSGEIRTETITVSTRRTRVADMGNSYDVTQYVLMVNRDGFEKPLYRSGALMRPSKRKSDGAI